jgi:glucose-6-phosphate 1-dehydrogenase
MSDSSSSDEHTTATGILSHSFVLFGALGDLSLRKLMPALYQLEHAQLLSQELEIMAVARSAISTAELKQRVEHTLNQYIGADQLNPSTLSRLLQRLCYCQVDLTQAHDYITLVQALSS